MSFNWVDILLVLVIAGSVAMAWQRGFILSVLDLARWIGSWLAALFLYRPISSWLGSVTDWTETWRNPIAFIFVAILTSVLIHVSGQALLRRIPYEFHKRRINRVLGMLPGLLSGFIFAALLSALLFAMPFADGLTSSAQESTIANRLSGYTDELETA
ncbi:MAG: CvpA family protein, partial [Pyrinomonadaceae bacterium]